jgi:UDP-N-acetylglucosamine 2-epimerase (non-hydrolysing)
VTAAGPIDLAIVVGTRPEAIKLAPVVLAARAGSVVRPIVIATGQHRDLVDPALATFGVAVDHRIDLDDRPRGGQADLFSAVLPRLESLIGELGPHAVLVQGDTASAVCGALAGFWQRVPVVHLEAGLRSFDLGNPFPEEAYRKLIGQVTALHLAPTPRAQAHLLAEGIAAEHVRCIGNTVVDAAQVVAASSEGDPRVRAIAERGRRLVLVTVHRRENWGAPLAGILDAIGTIVDAIDDIEVVLPVHPNPLVKGPVLDALGATPRVHVVDPLDYPSLIGALRQATLVLTDSGGIQEEAPAFATPALVLRRTTERPEAVEAGCAALVGTDADEVSARAIALLRDEAARGEMAHADNPFGDGRAAARAIECVAALVGRGQPPAAWAPTGRPPGLVS